MIKAQMDAGTAQVRAALGVESSKITTQQIQEALWHYYYDVDKSVTYLMTKFVAPSNKKKSGWFISLLISTLLCIYTEKAHAIFVSRGGSIS